MKVENCLYINVENRKDRKNHVEKQLKSLNINFTRFNAIVCKDRRVACSISHLKCIQHAKEQKWDHVMIVEDDIVFTNPTLFINNLNKFLSSSLNWDVVLVGGNNIPPYKVVSDFCIRVTRCQTTTGYIVKSHYYDSLINNIKEGIGNLLHEPEQHIKYAIDKYWFKLQQKDLWYLIIPLTVTQLPGYSDIEQKEINYNHLMLDLDKKWLFEKKRRN